MPRTRLDLDRQEKVDQLVQLAVRQLREGGYAALSIAAIAREAGIAQNAVYWYFPNKDHLLVAAIKRMVEDLRTQGTVPSDAGFDRRVMWFVDRIAAFEDVRLALRNRAREAEVVAQYARELDAMWQGLVQGALEPFVEDADHRALVADVLTSTFYGAIGRPLSDERRHEVVRFALERLAGLPAAEA